MKKLFAYFLLSGVCLSAIGQESSLKDYQDKYPGKNGVFLNKNEQVVITIGKTGEAEIIANHSEERLFLNDNYTYYTEESVGFSSFTEITSITPAVYTPNGDKFKKQKITDIAEEDDYDGSIFKDDMKKKSFLYSGLVKGGKTSLDYTRKHLEPHFFGTFFFSSYLPVESSVFEVQTPADMEITYRLFGNEKDKVVYTETVKGKIKTHRWEAKDLTDFVIEDQSVSIRHYATHMQLYINSYDFKGERKNLIRNLDDLYSYYQGFVANVNRDETPVLDNIADSLTKDLSTNEEKVKAIFYWVQDNIKYVAFEEGMGGFVPREAQFVCDRRYGDCKDMSSILYKMINSIGIPAYYTWIGTRDIPYAYNQVPTPSVDNHMICSYYDGSKYVFLDGTGKGLPYGDPTAFIQGKEALIGISPTEYKVVKTPILTKEECAMMDTVHMRIEDGVLNGEAKVHYVGYVANYLSNYINNSSEKETDLFFKSAFKKGNNKCSSEVTATRGQYDRDTPLEFDYSFSVPNYINENGDELYLNPFLKKYHSGDKIDLETNKIDKDRLYKEENRNVVYIEIPEGYKIEFMPENSSYKHEKFSCDIQLEVLEESNEILVQTYFAFDHLILEAEYFDEWNEMIKILNAAYSELIIFKKEK